jgi:hypothetical protein
MSQEIEAHARKSLASLGKVEVTNAYRERDGIDIASVILTCRDRIEHYVGYSHCGASALVKIKVELLPDLPLFRGKVSR